MASKPTEITPTALVGLTESEPVIEFALPFTVPLRPNNPYQELRESIFCGLLAGLLAAMWQEHGSIYLLIFGIFCALLALWGLLRSYRQLRYPAKWSLYITADALTMPTLWGTKTYHWQQMHAVRAKQSGSQVGLSFCHQGSNTARFLSFRLWCEEPLTLSYQLAQLHAKLTATPPSAKPI